MALATQCPHCYTSFRVANDQLKLHAGLVRCGACKQTFNGIEHLLAPGEAPRKAPQASSAKTEVESTAFNTANSIESVPAKLAVQTPPSEESARTTSTPQASSTRENLRDFENSHASKNATIEHAEDSASEIEFEETPVTSTEFADAFTTEITTSNSQELPDHATHFEHASAANAERESDESIENRAALNSTTPDDKVGIGAETDLVYNDTNLDFSDDDTIGVQSVLEHPTQAETMPAMHLNKDTFENDELDYESSSIDTESLAQQQNLLQQFSAKLETIESELGISSDDNLTPEKSPSSEFKETSDTKGTNLKKATALTNELEFELTSEERELVEQADLLHQLELENRAAILEENAQEWSKHEPSFDEESLLAAFAADEALRPQNPVPNTLSPFKPEAGDTLDSHKESETSEDAHQLNDVAEQEPIDDDHQKPGFVLQAEKKRRYGKWQTAGFAFACLLLSLGIVAQSVYFLRSTIAAEFPASKPHLVRACQVLSCQISLPAERHMLEVAGSELLILNEELKINTLAFQLQNKSNTVQEWPVVELTLEDTRGKTVLQKVFKPAEYVNQKTDIAKGMPARSESDHKLFFELSANKASNYRVSFFYP